jgi:hypothetical protein
MEKMKTAQGGVAGRGFPAMLTAMALALTVNAAFGMALSHASTDGQKIYHAWYNSGDVMVADAGNVVHKLCAKS